MNDILVRTDDDCDQLCAVLCRNGYNVTAEEIPTSVTSTINPYKWRIRFSDSKGDKK
jgi:hypothetical protein